MQQNRARIRVGTFIIQGRETLEKRGSWELLKAAGFDQAQAPALMVDPLRIFGIGLKDINSKFILR